MKAKHLMITGMAVLFTVGILTGSGYAEIEKESVIGMWLMNENEDHIAVDSSKNGNDGELKNGAIWSEGKFDEALELNGAGTHVEFGVNENLKPEHFTIVAWFSTRKLHDESHIFQSGCNWNDLAGVAFKLQDGCLQAGIAQGPGNTRIWCTGPVISAETWYHAALTFDGMTMTLYLNGEKATSAGGGGEILYDNMPVRIGLSSSIPGAWSAFDGIIDEVALFNAALTQEDIQVIMNEGLAVAVGVFAVSSAGKLATTWGGIRLRRHGKEGKIEKPITKE